MVGLPCRSCIAQGCQSPFPSPAENSGRLFFSSLPLCISINPFFFHTPNECSSQPSPNQFPDLPLLNTEKDYLGDPIPAATMEAESSSRLFVKNLPPTINETDFRRHFSTGGREVTDIKLIPKRRIGYVGYKTPEEAAKAVKFLNKSYIRMSKISVELARPISDPSLPSSRKARHVANRLPTPEPEPKTAKGQMGERTSEADVHDKKRKREDVDESDPKLREYLDVMRANQKNSSKLEGILGQPTAEGDVDTPVIPVGDESDDEYEEIPAHQPKRQKGGVHDTIPALSVPEAPPTDAPQPVAEDAPQTSQLADATDDDWLRSRTNRLLDLVDPDDPAAFAPVTARPSQQQPVKPTNASQPEDVDMEDAFREAEAEASRDPTAQKTDEDDATEQIRRTSRLFARNLPFKATEAELRTHFEKYGEVEEVCSFPTLHGQPYFPVLQHDEPR